VASSKSRQRELARAKFHRQMARKAASERRRRQVWASVAGFVAVLLIAGGAAWAFGLFDKKAPVAGPAICSWTPKPATDANARDVGTPPTTADKIPTSGTRNMNITFDGGVVEVQLDLVKAPCTSASFAYLASKSFFDNTKCHRLLNEGAFVLQCGDPTASGQGGPAYQFLDENLPDPPQTPAADPSAGPSAAPPAAATTVVYPKGTVAMANSGPATNGSQFFIVFKDSEFPPNYTRFGSVTKGLDVVEKIAAGGTVDNGQGEKSKPATDVFIQSLTVTEVTTTPQPAPAPTTVPPATPAVTPSASASAAPQS
jgi:peptidyl-prolyl cis-trans isomerase B (cyclophilin B)